MTHPLLVPVVPAMTVDRIMDLAYAAATEHREYWSLNGERIYPKAQKWLDSDSYKALKAAVEALARPAEQDTALVGESGQTSAGAVRRPADGDRES